MEERTASTVLSGSVRLEQDVKKIVKNVVLESCFLANNGVIGSEQIKKPDSEKHGEAGVLQ